MATQTVEAIFEHGTFHLMQPLPVPLRDGQRVRLIMEPDESPETILALAANVYAGLLPQEIHEVEQIALQRRAFFGDHA